MSGRAPLDALAGITESALASAAPSMSEPGHHEHRGDLSRAGAASRVEIRRTTGGEHAAGQRHVDFATMIVVRRHVS
jgi:hypothetical protein